jgi:hypothetical protein
MSAGEAFPLTRPTKPDSWLVIARSKKVAADWIELSNQVSGECQRVFDQLSRANLENVDPVANSAPAAHTSTIKW